MNVAKPPFRSAILDERSVRWLRDADPMSAQRQINPDTLKLLVDLTSGTPAQQVELAASFDAKTVQIAAAGGVLIGLTAAAPENSDVPWWLVLVAVAPFVAIVVSAIYCLWVRKFEVVDDPKELWETLYDLPAEEARHSIIARLAVAYGLNEQHLEKKRVALTVALVSLGLEVILVATALAVALS